MVLLALAALDLNRKCGSYCSDPVPITHPLWKPSVCDVHDVYNSIAFTTNIPEESWHTPTAAGAKRQSSVGSIDDSDDRDFEMGDGEEREKHHPKCLSPES